MSKCPEMMFLAFLFYSYGIFWSEGADGNVTWSVQLQASPPGGPFHIAAVLGRRVIRLRDVMFGDVWFCSGQSNMVYSVSALADAEEELFDAERHRDVRLYQSAFAYSETPRSEATVKRSWVKPSPENIEKFSAVCWLFGKKLHGILGYPVGLIQAAVPATRIEAWTSPEALHKCFPHGVAKTNPGPCEENQPSVLWNAMVHPFLPLSIYGVLWYQGEWNMDNPGSYGCALSAMVEDWRENWFRASHRTMDPVVPFGQVQLAPWRQPEESDDVMSFPALRWAQTYHVGYTPNQALPRVFTAVAMDLPDFKSPYSPIHPRYKRPIADRLLVGALTEAYHWSFSHQGPFPTDLDLEHIHQDLGLRITYDNSSREIEIRNTNITNAFEMCCSDDDVGCSDLDTENWFPAAIIDTGPTHVTVSVPCSDTGSISALRYAWRESPCPDELQKCGVYSVVTPQSPLSLPAPPFILQGLNFP